jgi:HlyD family secretion protein/epimerase transport system membrane fusion protein
VSALAAQNAVLGARARLARAFAGPADTEGPDLQRTIILGFAIIALFIGGFGAWAGLAPLRGAVIAPGAVTIDGKRKTIQHLEGGIVREIDVRDGEKVKADQVLLRLDDTQASANLQQVTGRYDAAAALVARLTAEELGQTEITFPPSLLARRDDPAVAKLMQGQETIFKARLNELNSETQILEQRDGQAAEEIRGLEAQIASERQQLSLIAEEIKDKNYLLQKGLIPKPEVLQLQRNAAQIEGQMNQNVTEIARAKQSIGETQLRISELRTNRINEASKDHNDALKDLLDNTEKMRAARDVLNRTVVRAPLDGTVMELAVHTIGGVVAPGATLMEIVPSDDRLEIEAKVPVKDIEHVRAGSAAEVRLVNYSQRDTPTLNGTVSWVSADRVDDQKSGSSYYTARVEVDAKQLAALPQVKLYPGMPVEAMILGAKRTALDYLLGPVNRTFARGMREN